MTGTRYYAMPEQLRRFVNRWSLRFVQALLFVAFSAAGLTHGLLVDRRRAHLPLDTDHIHKILLVRLELLGDVLMATPAIRALRRAYPAAEIVAITTPYTADALRWNPNVDRVLTVDTDAWIHLGTWLHRSSYTNMYRFFKGVRDERFDLSVSFFGLLAAIFSFIFGARRRVGYRGESYPFIFTDNVPGRRYEKRQHEVQYNLDLALAAGGVADDGALEMHVLPAWRQTLTEQLATLGYDPLRPMAVLHAGATNGSAKRWPTAYVAKLGDRLTAEENCQVVLSGGPGDRALAESVLADLRFPALNLVGRTSIGELAALIQMADVVVSGDSGPLHMAVAVGTPVVGLYGPTDPVLTGPYSKRARVLRLGLECSPCYDHLATAECPLTHQKCMKDLPVDLAFRAARGYLPSTHIHGIVDERQEAPIPVAGPAYLPMLPVQPELAPIPGSPLPSTLPLQ